jgi:hypothetical protein
MCIILIDFVAINDFDFLLCLVTLFFSTMASLHKKGEALLAKTLDEDTVRVFATLAEKECFTPAQWRSLIFNTKNAHTITNLHQGTWTPHYIVNCISRGDSLALAEPSIKRQRTEKPIGQCSPGVPCPSCHRRTLVVDFVYRSTGPGRKREEVRTATCSHCLYKETPE